MLTDDEIVAAFPTNETIRHSHPGHINDLDYRIVDAVWGTGEVDFAIEQRTGERARLVISLPSSGKPLCWLYAAADNAADWVSQLLLWIDEEVHTLGLGDSRVRSIQNDDSYVVVENYGWRVTDAAHHEQLKVAAGPFGWAGVGEA